MRISPYDEWAIGIRPRRTPPPMNLPAPRLWLHHGADGTSTVQTARGYARYHINYQRWAHVGYSFLIADGRVLEGRGAGRQGAHTQGENDLSHGICLVGDYTNRPPSDADLDALRWLLRHGFEQGWWPAPKLTGGHRDAPGANTSCPGDGAYGLIVMVNEEAADEEEDDVALSDEDFHELRVMMREELDRHRNILSDVFGRLRRGVRKLLDKAGVKLKDGP